MTDIIHTGTTAQQLTGKDTGKNPFDLFNSWYEAALKSTMEEPSAMALATANIDGKPSARMVLLKEHSRQGVIFFTNYESRKGTEITGNPFGALVFWWETLQKQIRIEGRIERIPENQSDSYFKSRPRGSRIGALISRQSTVLDSYDNLLKRYNETKTMLNGKEFGRPDYWGGFRLIPDRFEFWQGRPNRLHERLQFRLIDKNKWISEILSP